MTCPIHGVKLLIVCGTPSCWRCYEADLLAQPMPKLREEAQVEIVYSEGSHRDVMRRKRHPNA